MFLRIFMHMDRIPEKIDSKFRYVLLSARRAEQLIRGAQERMPRESPKLARHAMQEISNELVEWDYGEAPESSDADGGEEDGAEAESGGLSPPGPVN